MKFALKMILLVLFWFRTVQEFGCVQSKTRVYLGDREAVRRTINIASNEHKPFVVCVNDPLSFALFIRSILDLNDGYQ